MRNNRRRRLSLGSVLALMITALAVFGTFYFIKTVANDSPAAAMGLSEIVDAFGKPFQATQAPNANLPALISPEVSQAAAP